MKKSEYPYLKQIFVCTNQKEDGTSCCGSGNGETIFRELRNIAKDRRLHPKIRVAQAKCLGQCAKGVNVMVYEAGKKEIWYEGVGPENVANLADEYIQ